jgi:polysaccharide pyruvyl transferase WcaK-like protein|tara:strand:+ start:860 stop:1231 length:372 start_codon:yes stop_codon:yes gene_type:complete
MIDSNKDHQFQEVFEYDGKPINEIVKEEENKFKDEQEKAHQDTYENEVERSRTVTIPLREFEKLTEQQKTITNKDCIAIIDKIEELVRAMIKMRIQDTRLNSVVDRTEEMVRALRKHIVRTDI